MENNSVTIKLEVTQRTEEHVRVSVRAGVRPGSLALAGELCLRIGEYQLLGAALLLGAERMQGQLKVETSGFPEENSDGEY